MAGKKQYKALMLGPDEQQRDFSTIIWEEQLEPIYGDKWYWELAAYLSAIPCEIVLSPIHDQDTYDKGDVAKWMQRADHVDKFGNLLPEFLGKEPKVGTPKKRHVHVAWHFSGNRTARQVAVLLDGLFMHDGTLEENRISPYKFQRVLSRPALYQYFAHLNCPEEGPLAKHIYPANEVLGFGGVDLSCLNNTSELSKMACLMYIFKKIEELRIRRYHRLVDWARDTGDYDIISCCVGRASMFASYFRSCAEERAEEKARKKEEEKATKEALDELFADA